MAKLDNGAGKCTPLTGRQCTSHGKVWGYIIILQINKEQCMRNTIYQAFPLRLNILESLEKEKEKTNKKICSKFDWLKKKSSVFFASRI